MLIAILISLLVIYIASLEIKLNIKSKEDTLKIDMKIGFVSFLVPHQKIINKIREKSIYEKKEEFVKFINKRDLIGNICKHSSLIRLYVARFSSEELYVNPFSNGIYHIVINRIKGLASIYFKRIDQGTVELIYNPEYENIDYYIEVKTDVISMIKAFIDTKFKGD